GIERSIKIIDRARIVTPSRIPIVGIPIVPSAKNEDEMVAVMRTPPPLVMPGWVIVREHDVLRAMPVVRTGDVVVLIKFHRLVLRISILRHIELLNFVVIVDRHILVYGLGFVELRVGGRIRNIFALILPFVTMFSCLLLLVVGGLFLDVC